MLRGGGVCPAPNIPSLFTRSYRTQCFCGNSTFTQFLKYGTAAEKECNTPCSGNSDEMCGGDWKLSVYQTTGRQTWVGGTDFETEGDWMWFPARSPLTYTHWLPGEPNNQVHEGFDREHCMSLFPNQADDGKYMWNDEICHKQLHFVCEMTPLDIA
ncbi:hypothetical protein FSP39_002335 [Pinctada imbricata]|uniref:C-type lectin domain-containing protein n=1 Tax=Pinctada imbricata TaxID=66713 RepID=A0AA88YQF5_PINIB|nr:hypothetical protein FSP39_002335 [Pinctada imbricata]